jgi:hypothetical protein
VTWNFFYKAATTANGGITLNQNITDPDHTYAGVSGGQPQYVNLGNLLFPASKIPTTATIDDNTFWAIFELHQLGHISGKFPDDTGNSAASEKNDKTVITKCFPELCGQ